MRQGNLPKKTEMTDMKSEGMTQSGGCREMAISPVPRCMDMRMEKGVCDLQAVFSQYMAQCMGSNPRESMRLSESAMKSMDELMMRIAGFTNTVPMDASMGRSVEDLMERMRCCRDSGYMDTSTIQCMSYLEMMISRQMDTACMNAQCQEAGNGQATCRGSPGMKAMSGLQMMITRCMSLFMNAECSRRMDRVSGCTESHMNNTLCDLQKVIPLCMSRSMVTIDCPGGKHPAF